MPAPVRKAVFPVGGLGTRFLPATKALPKEMLPVVDKPLIQYAVEEAQAGGVDEFVFVTGRGKSAIEDHFDRSYEMESTLAARGKTDLLAQATASVPPPGKIAYTRQQEPMGLGHAVLCAAPLAGDDPIAVLLADDLILSADACLAQMMRAYARLGGNLVAVMEVPLEHTARYGIVTPGARDGDVVEVKGLVEKPKPEDAPSRLAVIGRYILQPEIFDHLRAQEAGAGGEIQLTDSMAKLIDDQPFHGVLFEGRRFDCGDKVGFLEANIAFALDRTDMREALKDRIGELLLAPRT